MSVTIIPFDGCARGLPLTRHAKVCHFHSHRIAWHDMLWALERQGHPSSGGAISLPASGGFGLVTTAIPFRLDSQGQMSDRRSQK